MLDSHLEGWDEMVINVADYASAQAALNAAPAGSRVYFPPSVSPVMVPPGGLILKSNAITIDAMGVEFHVSDWGTPAFLALRSNSAADDHVFRIGKVKYVGVRGSHTGASVRGSAPYCSGCGVWSNGDRNFIQYLRTEGMPTPIFFASWNGVGIYDRTGVGNRVGYLEASGYDFALLYVKQEGFDWGDAYCHDDINDSGGVNPTHAIYCSAASGQRAGVGAIGRWVTVRNLSGHAYQFKYSDNLTVDSLIADDCAGVSTVQNVNGFTASQIIGTRIRGIVADRSVVFSGVDHCRNVQVGRIAVSKITGDQTSAVGVWVDGVCEIESIVIESDHAAGHPSPLTSELLLRGTGMGHVGSVLINAKGLPIRPVGLGDGTLAGQAVGWTLPSVRSQGSDAGLNAIPVVEYAISHSNAWGDGANFLTGALPVKGIFRRGMRWAASAPSAGAAKGWVQTINGGLCGSTWGASTAVALGSWVKLANGRVVRYIVAGTTGTVEPNPSVIGSTGVDNTATWEYMATSSGMVVSEGNL